MKQEARPCFAKYLIERQNEFELDDDELAYLAGSMFGAGSDTVSKTSALLVQTLSSGMNRVPPLSAQSSWRLLLSLKLNVKYKNSWMLLSGMIEVTSTRNNEVLIY